MGIAQVVSMFCFYKRKFHMKNIVFISINSFKLIISKVVKSFVILLIKQKIIGFIGV